MEAWWTLTSISLWHLTLLLKSWTLTRRNREREGTTRNSRNHAQDSTSENTSSVSERYLWNHLPKEVVERPHLWTFSKTDSIKPRTDGTPCTPSGYASTWPSQMFSVPAEVCNMGHSQEFVGMVYCTHGHANMPMDNQISLPQYSQNYSTCIDVVQMYILDIVKMLVSKFQDEVLNVSRATKA